MGYTNSKTILIATLGKYPQVVTATLDILLEMERISEVIVIHTEAVPNSDIGKAVDKLRSSENKNIQYQYVPLIDHFGHPLKDIKRMTSAKAVSRSIYNVVREAKIQEKNIHMSIAGGRKTMTIFGMAAAQMLFGEDDRLWLLWSSPDFQKANKLHPSSEDDAMLIPVPFIPLSHVSSAKRDFLDISDPYDAVDRERIKREEMKYEHLKTFFNELLTLREREIVAIFVKTAKTDKELANHFRIVKKTISSHMGRVYRKAKDHHFKIYGENIYANRQYLLAMISPYIDRLTKSKDEDAK